MAPRSPEDLAPERLPPQPWLSHPATKAVMAALASAAGPEDSRFVGGCVRNALLGLPVTDIDIATRLTPEAVKAALGGAKIAAVPTGEAHGTITAISHGRALEITTLRRDVETDGRHAVVAFTSDWQVDAERRDFRLNALYADAEGRLFDPTGQGLADLKAGAIVFVGDPEQRIAEDALRILRFFRFQAWYGRGPPHPASLAACGRLKELMLGLSVERVAKELLGLMAADDPRPSLRAMAAAGVLSLALPESGDPARFEQLVAIKTDLAIEADPLLRLAALIGPDPAKAQAASTRLKLSNAQSARLVEATRVDPAIASWMSPKAVRQGLWRHGAAAFRDKLMLAWAGGDGAAMQWRALLPIAESWPRPVFPLTGAEVMAAGVPEGPRVGRVLAEVEAWWIDSDFTSDKLSIIERLKAVVQGLGREA
ncbi:MAG TPA: CCA tRNA nucleotidyltransferase [Caulobacteraceae bacterium]